MEFNDVVLWCFSVDKKQQQRQFGCSKAEKCWRVDMCSLADV